MPQTWVIARKSGTWLNVEYEAGKVYQVDSILAVQLVAQRLATLAKKPKAEEGARVAAPPVVRRRKRAPNPPPPLPAAVVPTEDAPEA